MVTPLRAAKDTTMKESELEESFQRGHGKGGQHQNTTCSMVRLRHKPSGLEVVINGRDQGVNRQTARQALAAKVAAWHRSKETRAAYAGAGRGDRSQGFQAELEDRSRPQGLRPGLRPMIVGRARK